MTVDHAHGTEERVVGADATQWTDEAAGSEAEQMEDATVRYEHFEAYELI
jgi:hypothetical protein